MPALLKAKRKPRKKWTRVVAAATIAFVAAAATWSYFACRPAIKTNVTPVKESSNAQTREKDDVRLLKNAAVYPSKPTDYMRDSAGYQSWELKLRASAILANAIAENEWSEAEAAANLKVSEKDIYNLMRDYPERLSMDKLYEMLITMGKSPALIYPEQDIRYSPEKEGNPDEIPYFRRAILLGSNTPDEIPYFTRAILLRNNKNTQRVYEDRAHAHEKRGEWDLAIADYSHCLQMKPDNSELLACRGQAHRLSGNYQAALNDLNESIRKSPCSGAYLIRANVYTCMGDFKQALRDCNEGIAKMDKQSPHAYSNRALVEERLGMTKEAIADYRKALEVDPSETRVGDRLKVLEK